MFKSKKIFNLSITALFVAVISVCGILAFPSPSGVAFTLQTFAIVLCGCVLGVKGAVAATFTYIILGAVGLPVFSGFAGGVQVLFGASGGFLIGFLPLSLFCGLAKKVGKPFIKIPICLLGIILCHIFGVVQFSYIYNVGFFEAILSVSLPFIVKDIISAVLGVFVSVYINKIIRSAGEFS